MKTSTLIYLFFPLFTLNCEAAQNCAHDKTTFRCVKYLKNYDADTITVEIPGVHPLIGDRISVRVFGIDAAEIKGKGKCEKEAARTAQRLVEHILESAENIELRNVARDKYFRILADVFADGRKVSDVLVKNGLAVAYDGGTKSKVNWCSHLNRQVATE